MFNKIIITLTFIFSVSSYSQEYVHDRFVESAFLLERFLDPTNDVLVLEEFFPIPYRHVSKTRMDAFKAEIRLRSMQYVEEARDRNIYLQNPTEKYVFSMNYYGSLKIKNLTGHCNRKASLIYLEEGFEEQTFYHELGHCDFDYSHKEDERLAINGYSPYVMSYNFNYEIYGLSGKKVLDIFFDFDQHNYLETEEGHESHQKMTAQIKEFKKKRVKYVKN